MKIQNNLKSISFLIFVILFLFNISFAELSALWFTKSLKVQVGDTVRIDLFVEPRVDHPVVTVSNTLNYDPEKLKFVDTIFPDNWSVLSEEPNAITDRENGFIRRTAGVANGINKNTKYMTYVFEAVKEGEAEFYIDEGTALDQENTNLGFQKKKMRIHIAPKVLEVFLENQDQDLEKSKLVEPKVVTLGINLFDKEVVVVSDKDWIDKNRNEIFTAFGVLIVFAFIYHLHRDHTMLRVLRAGTRNSRRKNR